MVPSLAVSGTWDTVGVAHPSVEVRRDGYLRVTELAASGELAVDLEPVALDDVGTAWERQRRAAGGPKLVILPQPTEGNSP